MTFGTPYKNRSGQEIELNCQASGDHLEFALVDRGEPADPSRICAQPLDQISLSGRETYLIKAIIEPLQQRHVSWNRCVGQTLTSLSALTLAAEGA
jgi:hypothetical protein